MSIETYFEEMVRRVLREELQQLLSVVLPQAQQADRRVTRTEAAAAAGVSPATITAWAAEGRLRRYGEGRNQRFSMAEVLTVQPKPEESKLTPGQRAAEIFRRHHGQRLP